MPSENSRIVLEVTSHRCQEHCQVPVDQRPCLVLVQLNQTAKTKIFLETGSPAPADMYACVSYPCGRLMEAVQALAPLQELVK